MLGKPPFIFLCPGKHSKQTCIVVHITCVPIVSCNIFKLMRKSCSSSINFSGSQIQRFLSAYIWIMLCRLWKVFKWLMSFDPYRVLPHWKDNCISSLYAEEAFTGQLPTSHSSNIFLCHPCHSLSGEFCGWKFFWNPFSSGLLGNC